MTISQVKDLIANNDMEVAIVRNQPETIDSYLRDMGYFIPMTKIVRAVNELRTFDAYYVDVISTEFAQ